MEAEPSAPMMVTVGRDIFTAMQSVSVYDVVPGGPGERSIEENRSEAVLRIRIDNCDGIFAGQQDLPVVSRAGGVLVAGGCLRLAMKLESAKFVGGPPRLQRSLAR